MKNTYDLIVRGGEVANHAGRGRADVGVKDGKIAAIGDLSQADAGEIVDAAGLTVLPGVIDTQVHFREPGLEWKEDLETGSRAFRGEGRSSKKKNMVIYVKPTIIDPAGNPKNRPGQLPFARTTSPDPVTFINPGNPNANLGGAPGGINNKMLNRSNYRR